MWTSIQFLIDVGLEKLNLDLQKYLLQPFQEIITNTTTMISTTLTAMKFDNNISNTNYKIFITNVIHPKKYRLNTFILKTHFSFLGIPILMPTNIK